MAIRIIWGQVNSSGKITAGSGDFTVSAEQTTGFYDVTFYQDSFSNTPAVTGTCVSENSEAPIFQVYSVASDNSGFKAETRDAHSDDKDWRGFAFTAIGTTDATSGDNVFLSATEVNNLVGNNGGGGY